MEALTAPGISSIPLIRPGNLAPKNLQPIHCRKRPHFVQLGFISGLRHCHNLSVRSATSDETSTDTSTYGKVEPKADSDITVEDKFPVEKEEDYDTNQVNEGPQEGSLVYKELFKFLEDLDIKFDNQDTYSLIVFGGGSAVALWLAAAVVGAIDSLPLLPKLLELIGLGYTVWFSSRYLIFKENRDELFSKVEQIKQEVLGTKDDK